MHAEMQAHARMSALINRRTAFIKTQLEFPFSTFHDRADTGQFVKRKVRRGFRAFPRYRNEPVLLGADSFTSLPQSLLRAITLLSI
jgi:hypothetical protein